MNEIQTTLPNITDKPAEEREKKIDANPNGIHTTFKLTSNNMGNTQTASALRLALSCPQRV